MSGIEMVFSTLALCIKYTIETHAKKIAGVTLLGKGKKQIHTHCLNRRDGIKTLMNQSTENGDS